VAALRGRRVGSNRAVSSYYYWSRLLEQGGLTLADVDLRDLPSPAMGEALAKGLVDVVVSTEPNVFRIVSRGQGKLWKPVNDVLPDRQNTFLLFGRRLLDERPDLGRRVAAAMLKAAQRYVEDGRSDRNVGIVARRTRMEPDEVRQLCWPQWSRDGRVEPRGVEEFQRWALAQGLIDRPVPFSQLVDHSFLPGSSSDGAPDSAHEP
jgi:ABC-type nitrate/sulfonate/bicarbonate transport system substrate-binding protein